jgi:hypothetical protein
MASTIQIPAEGRAVRSAGERKSTKTSQETSQQQPNTSAGVATPTQEPDSEAATTEQYSPDHHEIAQLAYSYWENRGYEHGFADEDWLRAERELRERRESQTGPNKSH